MPKQQPAKPKRRRAKSAVRPKAVIFDLGNTLYDKQAFVASAFRAIIKYLAQTYYLNPKITLALFYRIWKVKTAHYEFLLDNLLNVLGIYSPELMQRLLHIYHNHQSRIKPFPGVPKLLDSLKKCYKLAILTDGNPVMQRNKMKTLGIADKFDVIICTGEHPKKCLKPDPFCYRLVVQKLGVLPQEAVYVGDNPCEDFIGARQAGIRTVRVLQGEFKDSMLNKGREADINIKRITDLPKVI
jgi:putative hydrolase of the HAD superfamily